MFYKQTEVHPGVCPRPSIKDIMMQGPCAEDQEVDMCLSDEECDGDKKCCYNGCHRTCKEKDGEMNRKEMIVIYKIFNL